MKFCLSPGSKDQPLTRPDIAPFEKKVSGTYNARISDAARRASKGVIRVWSL